MTNSDYSRTESIFDRLPAASSDPFQDRPSPMHNLSMPARVSHVTSKSLYEGLGGTGDKEASNSYDDYEYRDRTRPTSITVVGVLLVITFVFGLIQVMSLVPDARYLPGWVWPLLIADYGLLLASIVGLFKMKKYGANLFLTQSILSTVFSFALGAGTTSLLNLVGSVIMLAFVYRKYSEME